MCIYLPRLPRNFRHVTAVCYDIGISYMMQWTLACFDLTSGGSLTPISRHLVSLRVHVSAFHLHCIYVCREYRVKNDPSFELMDTRQQLEHLLIHDRCGLARGFRAPPARAEQREVAAYFESFRWVYTQYATRTNVMGRDIAPYDYVLFTHFRYVCRAIVGSNNATNDYVTR